MYYVQFMLLYNIYCFANGQQKYISLQDGVNNNGVDSSELYQYSNVGNYGETRQENNGVTLSHLDSMATTLEESIKRIEMLEEKLRTYDKDSVHIKLLQEKLLATEELTQKHSYRINMLEKRLQKSEHVRRIQVNALQRRLKVFENRFRVAEEHLSHLDDFEVRLKRGEQHQSELTSESIRPPRTDRHKRETVNLQNNKLTQNTESFVGIGAKSSNYTEKPKTGHFLSRWNIRSDYIAKGMRDKRNVQHTRIGFSASLADNQHGETVHVGQTILYHNVLFNEDGAFDSSKGMYRCPVSGVYFFTITACSANSRRIFVSLVVNGEKKFEVFAGVGNDGNDLHDSLGSGSAILQCHAGDLVWTRVVLGETIGRLTFFTGFLLNGDSQSS
ncbi:hypothetical protein ACJMK2_022213 [Sinanodonta woodiana]|uniref:C1q domain-containing protein n=1 Tax=Sinanodonta woodiana TaxID=1069815 RepID=A0ABD3TK92_SINWO